MPEKGKLKDKAVAYQINNYNFLTQRNLHAQNFTN